MTQRYLTDFNKGFKEWLRRRTDKVSRKIKTVKTSEIRVILNKRNLNSNQHTSAISFILLDCNLPITILNQSGVI